MHCTGSFFAVGSSGSYSDTYTQDNMAVWEIISTIFKSHTSWTIIRPYQKTKDGRNAYLSLYAHHLGPSAVDNMSSAAEKALKNSNYKGESKKWNFDKYVRVQMEQHQILSDLKEHGYSGIDDRSKVRHLMGGINTAALDSVKSTILTSTTLRSDFTACVGLYQDFITQSDIASDNQSLLISAVHDEDASNEDHGGKRKRGTRGGARGGRGRGRGGGRGDFGGDAGANPVTCDDRFYSREDYRKLSPGNRVYLRSLRVDRQSKKESAKRARIIASNVSEEVSRTLSVLATAVDGLQLRAEETAPVMAPAVTNSTNSALQRVATRQGVQSPP